MNEHVHEYSHDVSGTHLAVNDRLPRVSWGAISAGLVVTIATSWLLHLFGTAIGVSIADASDTVAISEGMAGGAAAWIIVSWLVSFFLGSLVAARLAGSIDDHVGMLHGFTLWGVATIVMVVLGYLGISALVQTGQALVTATAEGVSKVASGTASVITTGVSQASQAATATLDSEFGTVLRSRLTDKAAELAASVDSQLDEQEMKQALEDLDTRTIRRMVQDLMNDDTEGAAQLLAENTELSQQDAGVLINGVYEELEQEFGNPENQQPLMQDLQNELARHIDSYIAQLDVEGGAEVTEQDVREAVKQLDANALQSVAQNLVQGDNQGAKQVLAENTNLTREQINDLYEGVSADIEEELKAYKESVNVAVETASNYAQSLLWLSFAGSAIALAVSLGGGWLGTSSSRRLHSDSRT